MANENKNIPMGLYWQGKKTEIERVALPFQTIETVNESRATREKEKKVGRDMFQAISDRNWYNRLIWGDNKYIMASLLEEFAGKIDLIYIDPPFATGADFSVKMEIGDTEWTKKPSVIEDKAYHDTWGKGLDSYLQMMYDRLILMRELLTNQGSIYVHLDWRVNSYVRILLDEIMGQDQFQREIVWDISVLSGFKTIANNWIRGHDMILFYTKTDDFIFSKQHTQHRQEYIDRFNKVDKDGRKYFDGRGGRRYLDEVLEKGKAIGDVWNDIMSFQQIPTAQERLGYDTQKPEALLDRIINSSSNEGGLVADFFCGSGTTGAVAEKLDRRWIMADLSRFAIHTARKRLLGIEGCKPFVVQNLGRYERQYWQGITFKKRNEEQIPIYEYIQFILKLYNAEPISGMLHIHGKKGRRLVHIGAIDSPVTLSEIQEAIEEAKKTGQNSLDILGWEWEMGLHDVVEKEAKASGLQLRLFNIPRDVMDPKAVEKGEITFYELAYLEVEVSRNKSDQLIVELKDFAIPNLDLIPQDVRDKIKKWSDYIDYWAVDWDWNQDTFHNMWQSYRNKKDRKLELKSDGHKYETKGAHLIMVKVIDIFGNDTTKVIEVKT